jgi:ketosteroid isomerase-like protein
MDNRKNYQAALIPEDLARFFVLRANTGDVEGFVALYEPDAVLAGPEGQVAGGIESIRRFFTSRERQCDCRSRAKAT